MSHFIGSPFIAVLCAIPNSYGGWPIIFYLACNPIFFVLIEFFFNSYLIRFEISATFGFIWMVCFTLTITSKPERHLNIDRGEKYFIADCLKEDLNEIKVNVIHVSTKNIYLISNFVDCPKQFFNKLAKLLTVKFSFFHYAEPFRVLFGFPLYGISFTDLFKTWFKYRRP